MRIPRAMCLAAFAVIGAGVILVQHHWSPHVEAQVLGKSTPVSDADDRSADRDTIKRSARDFVQAFERGDAKAIAAQWTEGGVFTDDIGTVIQGRANLEKAYSEHFQNTPKGKVDIDILSIHFPSRDAAIEEGLIRTRNPGSELPTSTRYSTLHVREDGKWKIAASREWGIGQDRLADLGWLIGSWNSKVNGQDVTLTFEWGENRAFIHGRFAKLQDGKSEANGTMRIAMCPQRGQLRSWHFDVDGGHGQSLWLRDGNNWVLDAIGVNGQGAETHAVNIIGRLNANEFTWRSIDRVVGDQLFPDTVPVKLTRATAGQ